MLMLVIIMINVAYAQISIGGGFGIKVKVVNDSSEVTDPNPDPTEDNDDDYDYDEDDEEEEDDEQIEEEEIEIIQIEKKIHVGSYVGKREENYAFTGEEITFEVYARAEKITEAYVNDKKCVQITGKLGDFITDDFRYDIYTKKFICKLMVDEKFSGAVVEVFDNGNKIITEKENWKINPELTIDISDDINFIESRNSYLYSQDIVIKNMNGNAIMDMYISGDEKLKTDSCEIPISNIAYMAEKDTYYSKFNNMKYPGFGTLTRPDKEGYVSIPAEQGNMSKRQRIIAVSEESSYLKPYDEMNLNFRLKLNECQGVFDQGRIYVTGKII